MTYLISKMVLDRQNLGDFAARAATHAVEMRYWRAHMERVKADEAAGVTGIDKHMPFQRPMEHALIEAAVDENDEMDYRIVDDGPTAEQILREKKDHLLSIVSQAEQAKIQEIVQPGRARLFSLRERDILAADSDRELNLMDKDRGVIKAVAKVFGLAEAQDMAQRVIAGRPEQDTRHLEQQAERRTRIESVTRVAAQAHHDIEDLTLDTLDAWQAPDFKGI